MNELNLTDFFLYQSRGFLWSRPIEMDQIGMRIVRPGSGLFGKRRHQRQNQPSPLHSTVVQMAFLPLTFSLIWVLLKLYLR
jgi:hypothetical protein